MKRERIGSLQMGQDLGLVNGPYETNGHVVVSLVHFSLSPPLSILLILASFYPKPLLSEQKEEEVAATMAAIAALQTSMTGLSLSSNSFLGQRFSPITFPSLLPVCTFLSTHHSFPNFFF